MRQGFFSAVFSDAEERRRTGAMPGLRYAEVAEITDEGYVLEWISGTVRSRSAPARVSRFMAGNERGAYFPFEVGDEVVVGFEDGDIDSPVILGGLWSDQDVPPADVDTSSDNNTRAIVSRENSRLSFDDTPDATKVLLKSAQGLELSFDDAKDAMKVLLKGPGALQLLLDGTKSAEKVLLEGPAGMKLLLDGAAGAAKALLQGPGSMKLEFDGSAQTIKLQLDDSTKIELSASGITVQGTRIDLN